MKAFQGQSIHAYIVAYMNAMRNKSLSNQVRYKVSNRLKDVRQSWKKDVWYKENAVFVKWFNKELQRRILIGVGKLYVSLQLYCWAMATHKAHKNVL